MTKERVSIVVPVYNVKDYLDKCLNTLVNQTMKDIEIIIVNDGSPDDSYKIIDKYAKNYSKLIKVLNQQNQGLSDARNNGLKLATADYVMFVDSDDYLNLDAVEKAYKKITSEKADVVIFGNNVVDESGNIISATYPSQTIYNNELEKIIFGNMCAWNKIYKKSLIEKSDFKFRSKVWYEDLDYSFKAFVEAQKTSFLEENLYNYLIRANSIMNSQKANRNLEILDAIDEIISYANKHNIYKKYYNVIEYLCVYHVYICAVTRVINMKIKHSQKRELIDKFINYTKNNFPEFKKNCYLNKMQNNKKIVCKLIDLRQFWLIKLAFAIKR